MKWILLVCCLLVPMTAQTWSVSMREVVSVELVGEALEVVWREPSHRTYPVMPPRPVPDRVWKEIYVAENGVVVLGATIEGRHIPAHSEPERIEFGGPADTLGARRRRR